MADIVKIRLDATNKQIVLEVVNETTGVAVAGWGKVTLKLGIDPMTLPTSPGDAMGLDIKLHETKGCDPTTGDPRYCMMLRSNWYVDAVTADPET
jgi:hypothetical protein